MKLSEFTGDMEVIQKLATFPNADDGLTAEQLKAKFDQAPAALKEYINKTLVPAVRNLQSKGGSLVVTVADGVADKSLAEVLAAAEEQRHVVLLFGEMRLGLIHADESGAIFTAVADGQMTAKVVMDADGMLSEQTFQLASKSALRDTSNELMGVRTGWDGTGYATAGQAVRCQFNEMNMQVENLARAVDAAAEADYYDSFAGAIADINAGVRTGKCARGTGCVKVVTSNTGKATVILLDDCYEEKTVTISADVDIALAGHTLSFTTAGAYLNFASGKCAIWGNVPGSRIINENLSAAEQVKLFSVLCERLEVHGGEYRITGTIDKTSMMFQIARVNQYCLFEDCTVYSDIYSTGDSVTEVDGVTKVAGFYQFANITNTGGNTVVKGGSWSVCTSGNNRAVMFSNVGTLTAEGVAIEVEAVNHNAVAFMNQAATVGEEQKYGTFHIRNCAISVRTDAEVIFNSFGVFNQYSGTVCHISDSTLFTDSRDFEPHEDGLGTWAVAIQNAVGATCYVTNVVAHGTHSCLSNQGKMYVNGGTYTGFCHGGIYCSHGAEGEAFVNDAHLRDGHYEGIYPDHYETNKIHSVGGFYIGGGESEICSNMSVYLDNCKIEGFYRAFVMRGTSDEQNNKAYLSNCEMISGDVARGINIHNETHRVYLTNCNYGKENATLPNCVIYTDSLYRKSANDKDLNTLVDYASKTAEIAKTLIVSIGLEDNGEAVADKTYEEIEKAYNEGREVVVVVDAEGEGILLSMTGVPGGDCIVFSANILGTVFDVAIFKDNTVEYLEILLSDLIPSGEVDPEAIEDAVEKYLTENPPAGGGDELLVSYTHTANKEIYPTEFDSSTGIFTCVDHGLSGEVGIIIPNPSNKYDMTKLPKSTLGDWFTIIDNDHFSIMNWDYSSDANLNTIDVSAFHLEVPKMFTVADIPVRSKMRIEIAGQVVGASWLEFTTSLTNSPKLSFVDNGSFFEFGRLGYQIKDARGIHRIVGTIEIKDGEIYAERIGYMADPSGGNAQIQRFFGIYNPPSNMDTMNIGFEYSGANNQGVANGCTVNVYGLK